MWQKMSVLASESTEDTPKSQVVELGSGKPAGEVTTPAKGRRYTQGCEDMLARVRTKEGRGAHGSSRDQIGSAVANPLPNLKASASDGLHQCSEGVVGLISQTPPRNSS